VQVAGDVLQKAGLDVTIKVFGLTSGISAKKIAFEQADVPHFDSWDELIAVL